MKPKETERNFRRSRSERGMKQLLAWPWLEFTNDGSTALGLGAPLFTEAALDTLAHLPGWLISLNKMPGPGILLTNCWITGFFMALFSCRWITSQAIWHSQVIWTLLSEKGNETLRSFKRGTQCGSAFCLFLSNYVIPRSPFCLLPVICSCGSSRGPRSGPWLGQRLSTSCLFSCHTLDQNLTLKKNSL